MIFMIVALVLAIASLFGLLVNTGEPTSRAGVVGGYVFILCAGGALVTMMAWANS